MSMTAEKSPEYIHSRWVYCPHCRCPQVRGAEVLWESRHLDTALWTCNACGQTFRAEPVTTTEYRTWVPEEGNESE
jgi:RNase P subunit RPR2